MGADCHRRRVARTEDDKSLILAVLDYKRGEVRMSGPYEEMIVVRGAEEIELVDTLDLGFYEFNSSGSTNVGNIHAIVVYR